VSPTSDLWIRLLLPLVTLAFTPVLLLLLRGAAVLPLLMLLMML